MNTIILGNIISLVGAVLMVAVGFLKRREQILFVQGVQLAFQGAANLVLGGFTGFITSTLGILRNILCYKDWMKVPVKVIFIVAHILLALKVNTLGFIGWLPIISVAIYTCFADTKKEKNLKLLIIVCQTFWVAYDFYLKNYVSFAFDIFTIISNTIGIINISSGKKTPHRD